MDQEMYRGDESTKSPRGLTSQHELAPMELMPDDVLYSIFSQCDIRTLGRLCRVCGRFNKLLQSDSIWMRHSKSLTLIHSDLASRCPRKIKLKEQCRISLNWAKKCFRERNVLRHKQKQLPWMQYSNQTLWISTDNRVKCYNVRGNGHIDEVRRRYCLLQPNPAVRQTILPDVSRFVVKDNILVSGCRDGSLHMFDSVTGRNLVKFENVHTSSTQTVDFHDTCIISGSTDKTVKILSNFCSDDMSNIMHSTIDIGDRIWSVGMMPHGRAFAVGTAGCNKDGESSLSIWDIERNQLVSSLGSFRFGAGVLDMKFEDDNTLMTCGYDTYLRMWDTRSRLWFHPLSSEVKMPGLTHKKARVLAMYPGSSHQDVREWEEPFDTTLYCLQTDNDVSVVTGTARYGMVRLWDKRSPNAVEVYYLGPKNSPVYSVAFDTCRLYAALDLCIVMADFSILPT